LNAFENSADLREESPFCFLRLKKLSVKAGMFAVRNRRAHETRSALRFARSDSSQVCAVCLISPALRARRPSLNHIVLNILIKYLLIVT
jgi:hypothetical protein